MKVELCGRDKRGSGYALLVKLALEGWRDGSAWRGISAWREKVRLLVGRGDGRRGGGCVGYGCGEIFSELLVIGDNLIQFGGDKIGGAGLDGGGCLDGWEGQGAGMKSLGSMGRLGILGSLGSLGLGTNRGDGFDWLQGYRMID